jgi:hypothetical protein
MPRFRFNDPWRILWQTVTSDYLLAALLLVMAAVALLTAWLPQTSHTELDLDVNWQAEVQRRFGGVGWFDTIRPALQTVGAFTVTDALGFRLLLALLAIVLAARLVDSIDQAWMGWRHGGSKTKNQRTRGKREKEPTAAPTGRHNRVPWGDMGAAVMYVGGLMILLGIAITSSWGWQMGPFPMTAGESVPLGNKSGLTLRLVSLTADGRRGFGELWRGEDTLVSVGELTPGHPLEGDGVGVYLVGSGDAVQVKATGSKGQTLELITGPGTTAEEDPILRFTENEPHQLVGVPQAGLVLLLTKPDAEQSETQPQVQVYDEGTGAFMLEQTGLDGTTLSVGEVSFVLTPAAYAEIRTVYDRGAFLIQLGMIGLIVGAILWVWASFRRKYAVASATGGETMDAAGVENATPSPKGHDADGA